jgi:hypothetical protein
MCSPELSKAITKSKELSIWISQNINGLPMVSERRTRLAVGCLHLAFDHHDAIILLTEHVIYGSAFALLRLIFEAYVRGSWLLHCASETDLDKFEKDNLDRSFGLLISDLEKLEAFSVGVLSQAKQDSWKLFNSFTHSGYHHVRRRNTQNGIEANYPDQEIIAALDFAGALAIMSTIGLATAAGNSDVARSAYEKSKLFSVEVSSGGN